MTDNLLAELMALHEEESPRNVYIRAPFGYPGAKSRSLDNLLNYLPYLDTYVEPCGGTGVVLLNRKRSKLEVFNERHSGIVSLYRCIRDQDKCKQLIERLELVPSCSREEFLWCRDTWEHDTKDDIERAARWYYSVVNSFNSKSWSFGRVTSGFSQANKYWNNLRLFWPIHTRLKGVQLENMDWREIIRDYKKCYAVWYFDPPYWKTGGNYEHEWPEEWHIELCHRIHELNGFVALSGYDCPEHPYNKFNFWTRKVTWEVYQSIKGQAYTETNHLAHMKDYAGTRDKVTETLWIFEAA